MRFLAVSTVGVLLVGACSGSLSGSDLDATPSIEPVVLEANPLVSAMVARQTSDPRLGSLISESEAAGEARCVGSAILDDLGTDRVGELIDPESGVINVELMNDSEAGSWAGLVAGCDDGGRRLRSLLAVDDSRMADCVTEKILSLHKLAEVLGELVGGVDIQDTNEVAGFRYSCQTSVIDEMFGPHPPGTMGEDLRLISTFLASGIFSESESSAFEHTCLVRGVMSSLPEDLVTKFKSRGGPNGFGPYDVLVQEADPVSLMPILDQLGDAEMGCIDPFKLVREGFTLFANSARAEACVRDSLSESDREDIASVLTRTPFDLTTGVPKVLESRRQLFEDCGVAISG